MTLVLWPYTHSKILQNNNTRRGGAAGVTGVTTDHLRPVLDNIRDTHLLHQMGEQLATARVPPGIHGTED